MIPQQWRDDPAFAQALRPYVDAELTGAMPYNVTGLATAMAPQDARAALLRGLDSGRPYAAAATLAERYLDDDQVREALTSRLRGDYAHAAPMAGVAIDVLGPGEGFAVLVSLLRQPDQAGRYEERVVVAEAVADAWQRFEDAARKQDAEAGPARDVLASYDPAELAALCTAVSPHPLMWHAPSSSAPGPGSQPSRSSQTNSSTTRRLSLPVSRTPFPLRFSGHTPEDRRAVGEDPRQDPQPAQAHRAGTPRGPGVRTRSQLAQRARPRRSHGGMEIRADTEVRRIAFIGLIQAITRHQQAHDAVAGDRTVTPEMEWLRQEIRRDLCAYGPELEERRQLAWIGMLMLGDLTLIDGIRKPSATQARPASSSRSFTTATWTRSSWTWSPRTGTGCAPTSARRSLTA